MDRVGTFSDDEARRDFLAALDVAMERWPLHEDRTIETDFGRTAISIVPGEGAGDPVVLLQGGGSTIAIWSLLAAAWRSDRSVVAIDTVWDAGRSEQLAPVRDGRDASAWLDAVLDGAGIAHAHLVGYSYGAWLAMQHAARAPERLRSVTAIEPPGALVDLPPAAWAHMLRMLVGGTEQYRTYLAWVRGGRLPDSTMLDLLLAARRSFTARGTPRPARLSREDWRGMRVPLAVVLAGRSRLVPTGRATRVVRRRAPSAELHVLPAASHAVLVDEPETLVDVVASFAALHDPSPHVEVHDA